MPDEPSPAALLDGLTDAQRQAVMSDAAPLCILAGAGTGKTRVLTRRIAYRCTTGSADPRHVLALTFTRKAAGELVTRVRALGLRERVAAGTFHAMAYGQLRTLWNDRGQDPPTLLDRKVRFLARIVPRGGAVQAVDAAGEIEWAKARLVSPDRYASAAIAAGRRPGVEPAAMAAIYDRYETEKRNKRMVDFDDLLDLCARAIEADPQLAAAQRWRYRHLFVDEFQDVNPLQLRLLEAWRGGRDDLCVVGDPNQAIYGWNGADPNILINFQTRFGGATVTLAQNHRSTPQVLAVANQVLDSGGLKGVRLRATRGEGPVPAIAMFPSDRQEARAVARAAHDRHAPGVPWSHQAVLTRTNAQTVLVSEAFRAVRIPFRVRGQTPFLELPEVRDALRELTRARSSLATSLAALEASLDSTAEVEADPGLAAPGRSDAELARIRNLEELLRLAGEYITGEHAPTADRFVTWLTATVGGDEGDGPADAVDLVTFHAAKGLEWPIVHLAGLEAGLVPIGHARTPEALIEERRLFYVAVTRAERELRLSWAAERAFGSRVANRRRSPYLDDVEPLIDAMVRGASPVDAARHLPAAREVVRAARTGRPNRGGGAAATLTDDDRPLFDDLRKWRTGRAKAADVPAFVIADDKTLVAIASMRPADRRGLLAVHGIGAVKAERFGEELLQIVRRHTG